MKVNTLITHEDTPNKVLRFPGDIYECSDYRAKLLMNGGFVKEYRSLPAEKRQTKVVKPQEFKAKKKRGRPKKNSNERKSNS